MNWIDVSKGLETPVIALLGLYIAYQQWRTNRNRLKYELFERRYGVYKCAGDFLYSIMREGRPTPEAQSTYLAGIQGANFLLGSTVAGHLHEIWKDGVDLEMHQFNVKDLPIGDERAEAVKGVVEVKQRLPHRFERLDSLMAPYLMIARIR